MESLTLWSTMEGPKNLDTNGEYFISFFLGDSETGFIERI